MSKKIIGTLLLSLMSLTILNAAATQISYRQNSADQMIIERIPDNNGWYGFLIGTFTVIQNNNAEFDLTLSNSSQFDVSFRGIFPGSDAVREEKFHLYYTWNGGNSDNSISHSGVYPTTGLSLPVNKKHFTPIYLKLYLAYNGVLSGNYYLTDKTLPTITIYNIGSTKFSLTVDGTNVTNNIKNTPITNVNNTPQLSGGNVNVPGVSTEPGAMTESVTPRLTAVFLQPGTDIEINDGTRNLNYDTILSSPGNVAVTDIKITVSNSDFSERVMSFSQEFDVTLSSDGILSDSAGRAGIPYTMKTSKGTASGLTIDKNLDTYHLSELTTGGYGIIKVVFDFQDVSRLLNAVAGTYSDTVTVTVTATQ